jgi:uncharacterized protein YebE (UPF0316 family)
MNDIIAQSAPGFDVYAWVVIPVLIFLSRIVDVSIGTVRLICVSRGFKYLAPMVGFFEVLVWLLAIGQIMKNLSNAACYIAYAGGFSMGNFVGMVIAEKLSLGMVLVRVVTKKDASELVEYLKSEDYGVTCLQGRGSGGPVQVVFTIVQRGQVKGVIELIDRFNPDAFYSIEEVGSVEKGVFPRRQMGSFYSLSKLFRPFRKGK